MNGKVVVGYEQYTCNCPLYFKPSLIKQNYRMTNLNKTEFKL